MTLFPSAAQFGILCRLQIYMELVFILFPRKRTYMDQQLTQKYQALQKISKTFIGYPCSADFSYEALYRFLTLPLNNVGDPWSTTNYQLNTHEFEREVIQYFAHFYAEDIDYWGYVNNGGSEGNLCGLWLANQCYPTGVVYYSRHSHYSVSKAIDLTRSESVEIPVDPTGEINYEALQQAISQHPHRPVILMLNIGTTMTGAIDDVHRVKAILNTLNIQEYYIHCDCALHGLILPYTQSQKRFKLSDIHSLAISGHKFIGCPIPCGVFLTHKQLIDKQKKYIEYIHIHDCTITGSRNAITPLMLWSVLLGHGHANWANAVQSCLENTEYAVKKLRQKGIAAWANPDSTIVVFPTPKEAIVKKWQLACYEGIAHIVVMRHVDRPMIDRFVEDLSYNASGS